MRDGKEEIQPNFIVILQAIETSGCGRHSRVRGPYVVLVAFGQWTLVNMNADLSGAIECKLDCYSCMQNPRQGPTFSQLRLCLIVHSIVSLVNNDAQSYVPSFVTIRATTQLIVELYSTAVSLIANIVSRRSWKRGHCQNRRAGGAVELKSGALSRVLHTAKLDR